MMLLLVQILHQFYTADKLEFGIALYPWANRVPWVQLPIEPV